MAKKKFNYFTAFSDMIGYCVKAAEHLKNEFDNYDHSREEEVRKQFHAIENEADKKKQEIRDNLAREFVPPLEREDIAQLTGEIDDVVDTIEDVYLRAYMFALKEIPEEIKQFVSIIYDSCTALACIINELANFRKSEKIGMYIEKVNELERQGDKHYVQIMHRLHSECTDSVKLLQMTYCYERLEKCCDNCEDVADLISRIILKNS